MGFRPRWPAKETHTRKRGHAEAQMVAILNELDAGRPAAELARKDGAHVNTLRLWRSKCGGLETTDLSRLKELESENSQMEDTGDGISSSKDLL